MSSKKLQKIVAGTLLPVAAVALLSSCRENEQLVVPADRALEVYGAHAIYRYELICGNQDNGEFWLKTVYQDGTTEENKVLLRIRNVPQEDIEKIKENLKKYQTAWIDPDYVNKRPTNEPDGFNRGVYKSPVSIEKNATGTIVYINNIDALKFIKEYKYSVERKERGEGQISPNGIKEPQ
ncbi:MAG: hypothetical protein QXD48_01310 [Candidatus Aenigmatarchaeota archaeon]